MPVKKTSSGGYKWGEKGKTYYGPNAKEKAAKQGRAIKANQTNRSAKNANKTNKK